MPQNKFNRQQVYNAEGRTLGFSVAVGSQANYLTSLGLSFFFCQMRVPRELLQGSNYTIAVEILSKVEVICYVQPDYYSLSSPWEFTETGFAIPEV